MTYLETPLQEFLASHPRTLNLVHELCQKHTIPLEKVKPFVDGNESGVILNVGEMFQIKVRLP